MILSRYLGRIPFSRALAAQDEAFQAAQSGPGTVLGFESEPVITLGVRASEADLLASDFGTRGFEVVRVDRGGQATLHNPGQLVIFPVLDVKQFGPRAWVCHLIHATQALASELGQPLTYSEREPGLYTDSGAKVASIGVRIRKGVSTHGIAINLRNDLQPFQWIRACGREGASVAHLQTKFSIPQVFGLWVKALEAEVDKAGNLAEFKALATNVRL